MNVCVRVIGTLGILSFMWIADLAQAQQKPLDRTLKKIAPLTCAPLFDDVGDEGCRDVVTLTVEQPEPRLVPTALAPPPKALDDIPWIARTGTAPLAVNPTDNSVSIKTSLGQVRDYNGQLLSRRIDEAKAANGAMTVPKSPVPAASPLDVWTKVDVQGLNRDPDGQVRRGVGADYIVSKSIKVGVEAQWADNKVNGGTATQQDEKVAARARFEASPLLSIETATEWDAVATPGAFNAVGGAGTSQTVGLRTKTDTSSVSVAPKLKYPVPMGSGQTLEPFVTFKDAYVQGAMSKDGADATSKHAMSVGTGVTFTKPDTYSMSVTADMEGVGAVEPASVKSRFQLSVPFK